MMSHSGYDSITSWQHTLSYNSDWFPHDIRDWFAFWYNQGIVKHVNIYGSLSQAHGYYMLLQ
jgi:hypothetical protein